ncbi:MAG: hypothetical protein GQ578_03360 [Desulfuromonadaceae bacterium]|nr:hypothetical protein [Desulfuromonadaceae bacterium]
MSKTFLPLTVACCLLLALLSGCGGGGGGGGAAAATTTLASFIKWSSITPPDTITIEGISQDANYTTLNNVVTGIVDEVVSTSSSATLEYANDGSLERVTIDTPHTDVTWDRASGDFLTVASGVVAVSDPTGADVGIAIDALDPAINWEYQTFGIWETGRGTGSGTAGAITVGAPTTGSAIPVVGDATFTGIAAGFYVDAPGTNEYLTASVVTVDVDFLNLELDFNSTGTQKIKLIPSGITNVITAASNLDMSGTLSYAAGTNLFTGTVTATGLSGNSTGQFYGPNAEELGGVFFLEGAGGVETYGGAYGAAQ